ncbi:MAG: hypothetical protein EBS21_09940 [Sphingomonadaceae bacterium]|nr:hypothetical protein [Sphingomonadaceae bacterium]
MSVDFGSGLLPEQDHALVAPLAADPTAGETMNFWAYDPVRDIGINIHPRIGSGQVHCMVTLFLPGGRILRQRADTGTFYDPAAPGSAHVRYRCEVPFRRWHYTVDQLPAFVTSDGEQRAAVVEDETPTASITLRLIADGAAPVWRNGTMTAESAQMMAGAAGLWIGGRLSSGMSSESYRYDQLVRVLGEVETPDGTLQFEGSGLRSHVRGTRKLEGMAGTCWMSGLFPSGKGFGVLVNIGVDGRYWFSEACITDGTTLSPARVLQFPGRHHDLDEGRFWVQLASDSHGLIDIAGEDVRAFYWSMPSWGSTATVPPRYGKDPEAGILMKQALARYQWNGETGFGLNERSG